MALNLDAIEDEADFNQHRVTPMYGTFTTFYGTKRHVIRMMLNGSDKLVGYFRDPTMHDIIM